MTPNFTPEPLNGEFLAVGPAMMKVAAEECDGVMLHAFCTRKYLDEVILPKLQKGLDAKDKARSDFEISGGGFIVTAKTMKP